MKLYAENLGQALDPSLVRVERIRPREILAPSWQRLPLVGKVDSFVGRFIAYPRIARALEADLFHVVDHGQAFLLKDLDATRTVVTCHDTILLLLEAGQLESSFRPLLAHRILRYSLRCMRRAAAIIAVSERTRADLATYAEVDPARVDVIPPGLNYPYRPLTAAERAIQRRRLRLPQGPIVLHVGQTGFYKNIEGCLRVLSALRRGGIEATLVRAGHWLRPAQRQLAERLGITGSVLELGSLSSADLAAVYGSADVLLFPSLYEGFGWPPLESMASGTPVVCSDRGSLPEVTAGAALLSSPHDTATLTEHVAAVLRDPMLARDLRARGLTRAARFSWAETATDVLGVYRRVLA